MSYFSSKIRFKPFKDQLSTPSAISLFQRISLRSVKGITMVFLSCTVLALIVLWQPTYLHLCSLQREKIYWQNVLHAGVTNTKTSIPTMDQLPDMIERCRGAFIKEGVNVVALNVERFGERRETGNGASLDYSLVRFHLFGNWGGIVTSLKALEDTQEGSTHIQEVVLNTEGGEALLQIYFCTGES
jgi:hypothetical protein